MVYGFIFGTFFGVCLAALFVESKECVCSDCRRARWYAGDRLRDDRVDTSWRPGPR